MADSAAIKAGRAFVELYAEDTKLEKGLKGAEGKLKKWGLGIAKIGAAVFGAGAVIKGALDASLVAFEEVGSGLAHMSERTGIGVESLSRLSYAAGQTGVDMETLEGGIRKMQKTLGAASVGNKEAEESLERIGFTVQDLINLAPEEQFKKLADRLMQIPNPAQRAAATMGIFGKQGTALLPMLAEGSAGMEELMRKADELGLTMSGSDAQGAKELHGAMKSVWDTIKGVSVAIGAALAPTVTGLFNRVASGVGIVTNWIKKNREVIVSVSTIATAVVGAGVGIVAIGAGIYGLGAAVGYAVVPFTLLWSIASGVIGVLGAILSPIGLVVVAVIGLGAWFATTTGAIKKAIDGLKDKFGPLADDFGDAWAAIKTAIAAGDFQAAIGVAWAFIKLEFTRGVAFCREQWVDLKGFLAEAWDVDLFYTLKDAWIDVCAFMEKAWVELQRRMTSLAAPTQSWFAKQWINISAQVWDGKSAAEAQEILKTFDEDQARRGGNVATQKQFDDQITGINADHDKAKADNNAAHNQAREKWEREHSPDIAARGREKSGAEAEAEFQLLHAQLELKKAIEKATAASNKTHPDLDTAGDGSDEAAQMTGKSGGATGTFVWDAGVLSELGSEGGNPTDLLRQILTQVRKSATSGEKTAENTKPRKQPGVGA